MQQNLSFFGRFKRQKKVYGNYAMSQHADCYEKIAKYLNTTPQHVYEIAHGKTFRNYDDKVIGYELTSSGIITLSDFV